MLAVLTVAPPWRSFLTTLEWPLKDAIISAVAPPLSCEEARRCGGRMSSRVLCCELFECSCAAVHNVDLNNMSWVMIAVCVNTLYCTSSTGYCEWLLLGALNICHALHTINSCSSGSALSKGEVLQSCVK